MCKIFFWTDKKKKTLKLLWSFGTSLRKKATFSGSKNKKDVSKLFFFTALKEDACLWEGEFSPKCKVRPLHNFILIHIYNLLKKKIFSCIVLSLGKKKQPKHKPSQNEKWQRSQTWLLAFATETSQRHITWKNKR